MIQTYANWCESIWSSVAIQSVKPEIAIRQWRFSNQIPVDLVLLDLVIPGLSGVDVCAWIRARSDVPIIVLSARLEEDLKVAALDAGADDYVTKPFGQEELLARVRAFLRRSYVSAKTSDTKIQIGELCIDLEAHRVFISEIDLHLTRTEYAILAELANRLDAIVTHDELIVQVWGPRVSGIQSLFTQLPRAAA